MGKKAISNTFTVNTIDDGQSAPYYFQEWFAWSSAPTTPSAATEPTPNGGWQTSIPEQGSYAYLWRKCVRMVYNVTTNDYDAEAAQYFRMSGLNGTSIKTKGSVIAVITRRGTFPTTDVEDGDIVIKDSDRTPYRATIRGMIVQWDAMSNADDGDSYTVIKTCYYSPTDELDAPDVKGHLFSYSEEASKWLDLGMFQGESGETWYTHVAWATNVDTSTTPITVTGFVTTKSPNDTTHIWMGVLVDQNSGQDSQNAALYTWSNTKGDKGDDGEDAVVATCSPDKISIPCNADGSVVLTNGYNVSFGLKVGSIDISQYITNVTHGSLPTGVSITSAPVAYGKTIIVANTATATGMAYGITFTVSASYSGKTYSSTVNVALIGAKQGSIGERGKVGRFFYFGGVFDSSDNTTSFVVNDAQAPYFEHTEDNQKRYHVYNPDSNPSGGTRTMAQMWADSSQSWNNKPWEAMTNDFKYIITEALFANFAKLGSFIISGDWMLTHYGVIYDTSGTAHTIDRNNSWTYGGTEYTPNNAYLLFDADFPNRSDDGAINFCPSYCVDGLTGETYQQNAHIKGEIEATSGTIGGFNITSSQINSSNNNIVLKSDGTANIGVFSVGTSGTSIVNTLKVKGANQQNTIEIIPAYQSGSTYFGAAVVGKTNSDMMFRLGFGYNAAGTSIVPFLIMGHDDNNYENIRITDSYILQNVPALIEGNDKSYKTKIGVTYLPGINRMGPTFEIVQNSVADPDKPAILRLGIMENVTGAVSSVAFLRAQGENSSGNTISIWPSVSQTNLSGNGYADLLVGLTYSMSLGSLKAILDDVSGTYYQAKSRCAVLLTRTI